MINIRKNNYLNLQYYTILTVVALIAYWPLTFHVFSMKNDAMVYFLPWRYHISETIQNHHFPLWSPYLYNGMPLHEDIQSGAWNPVVLIISLFTRYNMTVLEWEMLIYIITGGIGFFKLCRVFEFDRTVSLLLASSYMCSGFIIDSGSIIPWVTSAAYLPFVFCYFKQILEKPSLEIAIKLAFSAALLFLAGYMSFFIVTTYILLASLIVFIINSGIKKNKKQVIFVFLAGILTFLICSPALFSYLQFFPYYDRGRGLSLEAAQTNPFTIKNTISFLFPPASYKLSLTNDINSRNSYFGLLPIIFLFFSVKRVSRIQLFILAITAIIFLISLGSATPVREIFFYTVPLFNTFRHPGALRIFTICGLLLFSGAGMNRYFQETEQQKLKRILYFMLGFMICVIMIMLLNGGTFSFSSQLRQHKNDLHSVKGVLDQSTTALWVSISCSIQIAFLVIILISLKRSVKWIVIASILNLVTFTTLCMPFTLVSQHKTQEVNSFIQSFPNGFPIAKACEPIENPETDSSGITVYGYNKFYEKRMILQGYINNPTVSTAYQNVLNKPDLRSHLGKHPFAYFNNQAPVVLTEFGPNEFLLNANPKSGDTLHIVQQYHSNWKVYIDNRPGKILKDQIAFMGTNVPPGIHVIKMSYQLPGYIIASIIISILVILTGLFYIIRAVLYTYEKIS